MNMNVVCVCMCSSELAVICPHIVSSDISFRLWHEASEAVCNDLKLFFLQVIYISVRTLSCKHWRYSLLPYSHLGILTFKNLSQNTDGVRYQASSWSCGKGRSPTWPTDAASQPWRSGYKWIRLHEVIYPEVVLKINNVKIIIHCIAWFHIDYFLQRT